MGRNIWNGNLVPLFHFFAYAYWCVVTVPGVCGKLVNVCNTHLIISFLYLFSVIAERKKYSSFFFCVFHLPGGYFWRRCPVFTMYHSLSETRHPLQPEEQEVGIDPLSSYSNKTGGEFRVRVHSSLTGKPGGGSWLALPAVCEQFSRWSRARQLLRTFPWVGTGRSDPSAWHKRSTLNYR